MTTNRETVLVIGQLATPDGLTGTLSATQGRYGPELRRSGYYAPARNYLPVQPSDIAVDVDHASGRVGTVVYMERAQGGGLVAVLECDAEAVANLEDLASFQLSGELDYRGRGSVAEDIELRSVALVTKSATVGKGTCVIVPGGIDQASSWHNRTPCRALLERAKAYHERKRWSSSRPHTIADPPSTTERRATVRPEGVVEYPTKRTAAMGPVEFSLPYAGIISVR